MLHSAAIRPVLNELPVDGDDAMGAEKPVQLLGRLLSAAERNGEKSQKHQDNTGLASLA